MPTESTARNPSQEPDPASDEAALSAEMRRMLGLPETEPDRKPAVGGSGGVAEILVGVIVKETGIISKHIYLGPDGKPFPDASACHIEEGRIGVRRVRGAVGLAKLISTMASNTALMLGVPAGVKAGGSVKLVTKDCLDGLTPEQMTAYGEPVIARTKEYVVFMNGIGPMLIDCDSTGLDRPGNEKVKKAIEKAGGLKGAVFQALPGVAKALRVERASTSSGLSMTGADGGEIKFPDSGGMHVYVVVKDACDIPRATRVAHERMVLAGLGWAYVSDGGSVLVRSPVDAMVGSPERLVFEGAPKVDPPLKQAARDAVAIKGEVIDTKVVLPDLTEDEKTKLQTIIDGIRAPLEDEAKKVREARDLAIAKARSKVTGRPVADIVAELASRYSGRLPREQPLEFDDAALGVVTVGDVLNAPDMYIGKTLADPIEPEYGGGRCKAKVLRGLRGDVVIHSFAHGDQFYVLGGGGAVVFDDGIDVENDPEVKASADAAHEHAARDETRKSEEEAARVADEVATEPVDLWSRKMVPTLPPGLLPAKVEEFVTAFSTVIGADPAGVAMAMLGVFGVAISDDIKIKVSFTWVEASRFWVVLVAEPSMKKSPVIEAVTAPLNAIVADLYRVHQANMRGWNALPKATRQATPSPRMKTILLGDTTVEGAQEVLKTNTRGVMLVREELSGFFGSLEQYSANNTAGQANRAFWLMGYDGKIYVVTRANNERTGRIANLSVSILGTIQPDVMRKIADAGRRNSIGGDNDGLMQRLTPIVLRDIAKTDLRARDVTAEYDMFVRRLYVLRPPVDMISALVEAEEDDPITAAEVAFEGDEIDVKQEPRGPHGRRMVPAMGKLIFSPAAEAVRADVEAEHTLLAKMEEVVAGNGQMASTYGKQTGVFVRMCVVFHCMEAVAAGKNTLPDMVEENTARRVAAFMRQFMRPHLEAFHADVLHNAPDIDNHRKIAGYVLAHGLKEVSARDVQSGMRNLLRGVTAQEVTRLMEQMHSLGWLFRRPPARWGAQPRWAVNPKVHKIFKAVAAEERVRRDKVKSEFASRKAAQDGV